ncbi:hypothetical protein [Spirosoma rhododendri]|uniref:Uncharacterized protein n=1 Tax=Spirosoma rhododendri TaxID=2728024 RepID=A0A7L5DN69_9BACT|nr:hypothetical protein [Spirosoma rhododendri]QJD79934.1 hypothetical protein HH216_17060 [Spirosoma rhododendri]
MRRFSVQIPQPCPQSWDNMQPNDTGRFCTSCQKTVVDYTTLSDQELIKRLARPTAETQCGRLRDDQFNRLLVADTIESSWQRWLSLLAMSWLGLQTALAQQHSTKSTPSHPTQTSPVQPSFTPIVRADLPLTTDRTKSLMITGRVLLRDTTGTVQPLANAYVQVGYYHGSWQVKTDRDGTYSLTITALEKPTTLNVHINSGGTVRTDYYSSCQIQTTGTEKSLQLNDVTLVQSVTRNLQTITGGGIAIIPAPTRWQRFWRSLLHREPHQNG